MWCGRLFFAGVSGTSVYARSCDVSDSSCSLLSNLNLVEVAQSHLKLGEKLGKSTLATSHTCIANPKFHF